jgi:hypothetical protein
VICGEEYVEKEGKVPCAIENPEVTNAHTVSSILCREHHVWAWFPKRSPSSLTQKVAIINIICGTACILRGSECTGSYGAIVS